MGPVGLWDPALGPCQVPGSSPQPRLVGARQARTHLPPPASQCHRHPSVPTAGAEGPALSPQIFTRLGKCYTFNPGGPGREVLTTLQGGAGNGLELMLNVQQEEYLPVWGDTGEGPPTAPPATPSPAAPHPDALPAFQMRPPTRRG